jgi:hypothetical protein
MRFLSLLVFIFSLFQLNGQSNTNTPPVEKNNSNTLNVQPVMTEEEQQADTLIQLNEAPAVKTESVSKKSEMKKEKSMVLPDAQQAPSSSFIQTSAVQQYSSVKSVSAKSRTQRTPSTEYQQQMDMAVQQLSISAPESFEYNFFRYQAGNYNTELVEYLNKAEALKPSNSDVHIQKAALHWSNADSISTLSYLQKLNAVARLSPEMVSYAEDMLNSVPKNGVLITHGIDDSFSALYVQLEKKLRKDVKIVSLEVLQSKQMRSDLIKKGFQLPLRVTIDVQYLQEFCNLNKSKNIGLSMTLPKEYLSVLSDKLYVTGLVFEYREEKGFNNFVRNDELWNDRMSRSIINEFKSDKGRQLSANYLPMLLVLSKTYGELNEPGKKRDVDAVIDQIAAQSNKYEQVKKLRTN